MECRRENLPIEHLEVGSQVKHRPLYFELPLLSFLAFFFGTGSEILLPLQLFSFWRPLCMVYFFLHMRLI